MYFATDNSKITNQVFNVGIYVRLSREDDDKGSNPSESIQNQKDFLIRFVVENRWNLIDIYSDDGYSGTSFGRPDFQRMLKDIECKRINMVVTKDLSRLGRDYIETGYYIEKFFPLKNVRYISASEGVDTFAVKSSTNDMSPFLFVVNDLYARQTSVKVRSVMDHKRSNGKFIGAFAPYGYKKDSINKNKLVLDENTAPVVKRIFEMYVNGHGYAFIASTLNAEGIPSPFAYKTRNSNYKNPRTSVGLWTHETIRNILTNPTYCGNLAQNKCTKVSYKIHKLKNVPRDRWVIVENTHDPIVDRSTFDLAQKMRMNNASVEYTEKKYAHLLSGLVYCGDCGERMTFARTQKGSMFFICSKYKRFRKLDLCSRHSILESDLETYIINDLRRMANTALDQERLLQKARKITLNSVQDSAPNEISKIEARLIQIKGAIKSLYEDKLKGIISEEDFMNLSQDYNKERELLNCKLNTLNEKREKNKQMEKDSEHLLKMVHDFINMSTIDKIMLTKLINKIEIFENKQIKIHYNFKKPY